MQPALTDQLNNAFTLFLSLLVEAIPFLLLGVLFSGLLLGFVDERKLVSRIPQVTDAGSARTSRDRLFACGPHNQPRGNLGDLDGISRSARNCSFAGGIFSVYSHNYRLGVQRPKRLAASAATLCSPRDPTAKTRVFRKRSRPSQLSVAVAVGNIYARSAGGGGADRIFATRRLEAIKHTQNRKNLETFLHVPP